MLTRVPNPWQTYGVTDLGFDVKPIAPDTPAPQRSLVVTKIEANGPAAKTELRIGDVITSIDGVDLRGGNSAIFRELDYGAPGTSARVALERGVTIEIVRTKH